MRRTSSTEPSIPMAINFQVRPFPVPTELVAIPERPVAGVGDQSMRFAMSQICVDTLSKMCDDFRARVFEMAGQTDPRLPQKRLQLPGITSATSPVLRESNSCSFNPRVVPPPQAPETKASDDEWDGI